MQTYANAQYYYSLETTTNAGIKVSINGVESFVPLNPSNADYNNIMSLVAAGNLTIAPAA